MSYRLGDLAASPEFAFSLQLVYLSSRDDRGLFGSKWFCPQLDTRVVPRGNGLFVWYQPSGGLMGFRQDPKDPHFFRSFSGDWRAKVAGPAQEIWNADGWRFRYERSRLVAITAPSGRFLSFLWQARRLQEIRLNTGSSSALGTASGLVVLRVSYSEGDDRIGGLEIQGLKTYFAYGKGQDGELALWTPAVGPRLAFTYSKVGALEGIQEEKGRTRRFQTAFFASGKGEKADRSKLANWWLTKDDDFSYAYGTSPKEDRLPSRITVTDRAGMSRLSDYTENRGMLVEKTSAGEERKTYFYRAPGQKYDGKLRQVEQDGRKLAEYRYDRKSGLLTESIDQDGLITFYDYPPGARKKTFEPGEKGAAAFVPKPVRVRQGDRQHSDIVAEYVYDDFGRVVAAKDRQGNVTRIGYTPRGEVSAVDESTGGKMRFAYDALGRRVGVEKNGVRQFIAYDALGRVVGRQDPDGSRSELVYDATGQIAAIKKNGQILSQYVRDAQGRVLEEKDPLGRVKKYEYDPRGNLLAEHAANGAVTRYEYDATDHRIAQIDANGNRIRFDYDPAGRLVKQTNALGKTLAWIYDFQGKLLARTNGVQTIGYVYDAEKRLRRIDYAAAAAAAIPPAAPPDALKAASSAPALASFFGAAAPTPAAASPVSPPAVSPAAPAVAGAKGSSGQTIDYTYDAQGRPLSAETPATRFEYLRDKIGQLEALRCVERGPDGKDAREQLIRYRTDTTGRRTGLILAELVPAVPSAGGQAGRPAEYRVLQQTEYTYDGNGRLASILDNGNLAVSYRYDFADRLVGKTFGNGIQAVITYDPFGRLAKTTFSGGPLVEPKVLEYTWDAASQVTQRTWNGQTQRYEYDPSGQLLKVTDAATKEVLEAYVYDKAGNMLEKTINGEKTAMTYNAANELATRTVIGRDGAPPPSVASSIAYHYDQAGRMLGFEGGPQSAYGWLDKVTDLKLPGGQKVTYTYWPDGQLAAKSIATPSREPGPPSEYRKISNHSSEAPESSAVKNLSDETFLWDGLALLRRNDSVYLIEPHPSGGIPIASHPVNASGPVTYYLNDLLGTTLATVYESAIEYAQLTSFGQPLKMPSGTPSPASGPTISPNSTPAVPPQSIQKVR